MAAATFAIRKPAVAIFTLGDYVAANIMTAAQAETLSVAVADRCNVLVAGGTATGKTILTNALRAEVAKTEDRVVLIEDTRELQCAAPNLVALRTKDNVASLSDLVRSSLRLRPDRISIGEVRGPEALALLKAWGTGHPGGIGTIHAGTALGALRRMEQLIQEAVVTVPRALITETIDLVVSFQQVVHSIQTELVGVTKLQHCSEGSNERAQECQTDAHWSRTAGWDDQKRDELCPGSRNLRRLRWNGVEVVSPLQGGGA